MIQSLLNSSGGKGKWSKISYIVRVYVLSKSSKIHNISFMNEDNHKQMASKVEKIKIE